MPCPWRARMEQRQNLLLEDTNVPRMWTPLLCIASWITACMNTYMHSCEATLSTWYCINEGLWAEEQYGVASTRVHPR
ncbi:hypothetical protein J3E68DRAFT_407446 [Trichoderma sp. SZMC 28012]